MCYKKNVGRKSSSARGSLGGVLFTTVRILLDPRHRNRGTEWRSVVPVLNGGETYGAFHALATRERHCLNKLRIFCAMTDEN
jgi:hypothetical protein